MEGGFGCGCVLTGLGTVKHHKWHVANLMVWPCGLGCQHLGPCSYACGGYTSVHSHFALDKITSCPAPLPCSPGEDNGPKPSCKDIERLLCLLHYLNKKCFKMYSFMEEYFSHP